MKISEIEPYSYQKIGLTTFVIKFQDEDFLVIEHTTEKNVIKTTNLLNGAFKEGVIFGQFNKIEDL